MENFEKHQWQIGDLGLSQPANDTSNNEIYGVIPEIFKGFAFFKETDVMWELTKGCRPFAKIEHDASLIYQLWKSIKSYR